MKGSLFQVTDTENENSYLIWCSEDIEYSVIEGYVTDWEEQFKNKEIDLDDYLKYHFRNTKYKFNRVFVTNIVV